MIFRPDYTEVPPKPDEMHAILSANRGRAVLT
jgi:hypothetical protein